MIWYVVIGVFVLFAALYMFMISPAHLSREKREKHDIFLHTKYAHRGLHTEKIPENSMGAYKNAIDHNFGIEIDVHITKDGEVVVFHDDTLKRMCGVEGKIEELTLEEIKALRLLQTDEKIPTFKEVLELIDEKVPLLIEIKSVPGGRGNELCAKTAELLDDYNGPFAIQSFDPFSVKWFRLNRKNFFRGQLSGGLKGSVRFFLLRNLLINFISRPEFVSYQFNKVNLPFKICTKLCGSVSFGWTVRSQEERKLAEKNVDTIIFENFIPQ